MESLIQSVDWTWDIATKGALFAYSKIPVNHPKVKPGIDFITPYALLVDSLATANPKAIFAMKIGGGVFVLYTALSTVNQLVGAGLTSLGVAAGAAAYAYLHPTTSVNNTIWWLQQPAETRQQIEALITEHGKGLENQLSSADLNQLRKLVSENNENQEQVITAFFAERTPEKAKKEQ